jgi:hypothetical protein
LTDGVKAGVIAGSSGHVPGDALRALGFSWRFALLVRKGGSSFAGNSIGKAWDQQEPNEIEPRQALSEKLRPHEGPS